MQESPNLFRGENIFEAILDISSHLSLFIATRELSICIYSPFVLLFIKLTHTDRKDKSFSGHPWGPCLPIYHISYWAPAAFESKFEYSDLDIFEAVVVVNIISRHSNLSNYLVTHDLIVMESAQVESQA